MVTVINRVLLAISLMILCFLSWFMYSVTDGRIVDSLRLIILAVISE